MRALSLRSWFAWVGLCAFAAGAGLWWLARPPTAAPDSTAPAISGAALYALEFRDLDGSAQSLGRFQGKWIVVNFWATWCAPCREEMPSLEALQAELGGEDFAVLTIASGRNPPPAIDKFFAEIGVETLPKLRDDRMALARAMGVMGLPVTVLIDREGNEVARLIGDADWASEPAKAVVRQLTAP